MSLIEEDVVKENFQAGILELLINRPKMLNALNPDLLVSLELSLKRYQNKESLRAVIISGAGEKAFVAGADIQSMAHLGPRAIADYVELGQRVMRQIETYVVPVIAAVNGYALGGGLELALACDFIIASNKAQLGLPEVKLGIMPGFGGTQRLLQRCSSGLARRMIYTGEYIDAQEGLSIGLVDRVVEPGLLLSDANNYARTISQAGPLAVRAAKRAINQGNQQALLAGLRYEVEEFLELFASRDREEGMQAFLEKREAKFTGK